MKNKKNDKYEVYIFNNGEVKLMKKEVFKLNHNNFENLKKELEKNGFELID